MENITHSTNSVQACQNCKKDFTIEADDFSFYEKINVPPPTWCPECRMKRRMCWRNCRSLHKRICGGCNKSLISMYSEKDPAPVFCTECWNNGGLDMFSYGVDYDFSRPFFEQLAQLFKITPRFYAYRFGNLINSEYTNYSKDQKNVYLAYSCIGCEDIMYSEIVDDSKNCLDCFCVKKIDGCFYNVDCMGNYNSHYMIKSDSCIDSHFLYDCDNCSNCFLSYNLRNQQYVFKNRKMPKEDYMETLKNYKLGTYQGIEKIKIEFSDLIENKAIHKYANTDSVENTTGDNINNTRNIKKCFDTHDSENISYSNRVLWSKDSMDNTGLGFGELIYESLAATQNTFKNSFCYLTIQGCRECEYSLILKNCSNCFGCVGLTNAQYCIFNKQYSKDEYFEKVEKIKKHMDEMPYLDRNGRVFKYGEFFPYEMSPFGYNETNTHDFFPISKEEAIGQGYNWFDRIKRDYQITIDSQDLPNDIKDVDDSILQEVIGCPNDGNPMTQCTGAYKIVDAELSFYRQKGLPLPRFCPNCRHYERLKYRNAMRLYHRKCICEKEEHMHAGSCQNDFETTYAPDRPEKVYCESCYNKEIY